MPHCRRCGKSTNHDTDKCRSCAMRERWSRPEERERFTKHNQEILASNWEDPEFRELQSKLCKERSEILISSRTEESYAKLANSVRESWKRDYESRAQINRENLATMRGKKTEGEEYVASLLDQLHIVYYSQYEICRSALGLSGPGRGKILDFYLPDYNIDLEIDGTSHLGMLGREVKDEERDELLESLGYRVYRIIDTGNLEDLKSSLMCMLSEVNHEY